MRKNIKLEKEICELEKEIILKLKDNKLGEKQFNEIINVFDKDDNPCGYVYNFYTYRGSLCLLDSEGCDVNFTFYNMKTRKKIHSIIMSNNYKKVK